MNSDYSKAKSDFMAKWRKREWKVVQIALGALAIGVVFGVLSNRAQPARAASGPNFDSFKIITQRNIFDPNRTGIRSIRRHTDTPRTRVVDSFALVGTMSYEKGKFAFFDGTSSQYKKVLEPGANIAGYTVKDVTPKSVTLAANGKEFQMNIGTQLRNEGANGWRMSSHVDTTSDSGSDQGGDSSVAAQPTSSTPPTGSSPEANDVLKKLMQLREQELK